jgi:hypothetical protein
MDYALKKGVRNFVVQNPSQLMLLYVKAKELGVHEQVAIMTRIVPPRNATYVSGGKFGSDITLCEKMLQASHNLGMKPRGLATHIGWQTDNSTEMRAKIEDVLRRMAATFKKMKNEYGIELTTLDLGGGWPSQFRGASVPHIRESAAIVAELMDRYFGYLGNQKPDIILEPGNYLAAAAGVTKAHIINIEEPMEGRDFLRCVLDVGKLQGGLIDGHYPVSMIIDGEPVELFVDVNKVQKEPDVPVIVFGPSLDSADRVIADIKLTDHPKIRELFAGAIEANRMDNDIVDKLDDDSAFAVTVAQKVKENFPLPIVLHGTGAYTTALTVGEPGKPGFNGILNPGLTVISNNYVNKTMERELLHLENAHTIEKLKSKIVEEAAWSQFQSERRELQDQLAPTGTSDTVS